MGVEVLRWFQRALGGRGGPEIDIEGFGRYGGASDGCEWVGMCLDPYHQYQALHIHLRPSMST